MTYLSCLPLQKVRTALWRQSLALKSSCAQSRSPSQSVAVAKPALQSCSSVCMQWHLTPGALALLYLFSRELE